MDNPDKNRIAVATLSKFEDSPIVNYISTLSPIEQIKFIHTNNLFNSVALNSPSSLFATPKISSLRESRFLLSSNQSPDILKPDPSHGKENKISKGKSEAVQLSEHCTGKLGCLTPGSSARGVFSTLLVENLDLDIELPKTMKYDGETPVNEGMSFDVKEVIRGQQMAGASSSLVQSNEDSMGEDKNFENKSNLLKILRIEPSEDVAGCDWVSLISGAVLNSNLSIIKDNSDDEDQKTMDSGEISFISTVLQFPQDSTDDLTDVVFVSPCCSCTQSMRELVTQPEEIGCLNDVDQRPDVLSNTLLNKLVVSDPKAKMDKEEEKCDKFSCKQHNICRRCLVFEMAGAPKMQAACESTGRALISSQTDCKDAYAEKHFVPGKTKNSYSSMVAGVGLHLNALATNSKNGKVVKCETLASGRKLISMRSSVSTSHSLTSCQSLLNKSSTLKFEKRDSVPDCNKVKAVENAMQPSVIAGCEEFDHSSPKRKRCKPEHNGESKACNRCSCKRSKCLKLYCECFAAGLYCVEPCSCLDCFNKPFNEDKVLETRRQIEFRNPLAFAPKVIRNTDSAVEFGDGTNKTPASARHKKGCNCKRSSCLKKYCECFQGGVGCSISCRCEGCKNSFGRKDGAEESDYENEESNTCEKNEADMKKMDNIVKEGEEQHPDLLLPSSYILRAKCSGSSLAVNPPPKLCTAYRHPTFSIGENLRNSFSRFQNMKLPRF